MADLITNQRAIQNPLLAAVGTSSPAYLSSLVTAASDSVKRYCHREFLQQAFTEYQNGGIYKREGPSLRLREYPVIQITRIAGWPQPAIQIINNDTTTNQRATAQTLVNGDVVLWRIASGVQTTNTLSAATNITIGALVTAINALGGGWTAQAQSSAITQDFSKWPQTDLKPLQGAATAFLTGAYLEVYTEDIQPLYIQGGFDWLTAGANGWELDAESGEIYGILPRGQQNIRIDYTAGYAQSALPQSIQEAVVQLALWAFQSGQLNQALKSAKLGNTSFELKDSAVWPPAVIALLARYVAHDKVIYR